VLRGGEEKRRREGRSQHTSRVTSESDPVSRNRDFKGKRINFLINQNLKISNGEFCEFQKTTQRQKFVTPQAERIQREERAEAVNQEQRVTVAIRRKSGSELGSVAEISPQLFGY
jgi:hypothetical protein